MTMTSSGACVVGNAYCMHSITVLREVLRVQLCAARAQRGLLHDNQVRLSSSLMPYYGLQAGHCKRLPQCAGIQETFSNAARCKNEAEAACSLTDMW